MAAGDVVRSGQGTYSSGMNGREPANLGDILERVLDKGLVIAGDIRVNLLDIELLTIKLRLVIASLETAREVGINWWEHDPWLSGDDSASRRLTAENERLRRRIAALESGADGERGTVPGGDVDERGAVPGSDRGERGASGQALGASADGEGGDG